MELNQQQGRSDLSTLFTGVFVASLLIANVASQKMFALGPFTIPAGTIVFPLTFIIGDILTEVYGFARARRVIWIGFLCQLLAAISYIAADALPPAEIWENEAAFEVVLGVVPRIVLASMTAYWLGEFCNSFVLSRMKARAKGARGFAQAWRFMLSTLAGQAIDSAAFVLIAFAGVYAGGDLAWSALSLYLFKIAYEIVLTPVTMMLANWVKRVEGMDTIDDPRAMTYNPFSLR